MTNEQIEIEKALSNTKITHSPELIFKFIHSTIQSILKEVPIASVSLYGPLMEGFPPVRRSPFSTVISYFQNLLEVTKYCPTLRDKILELCIDQMISIDIQIRLEDIPDEDDEEQLVFELEEDCKIKVKDSSKKEEIQMIKDLAHKLDNIMILFYNYIDEFCNPSNTINENLADEIFILFLRIFDLKILKTIKSKYTQFLIFYLSRLKETYSCQFLGYLLNKMADVNVDSLSRQSCSAYIGSYISRAIFIKLELVKDSLYVMVGWVHDYLENLDKKNMFPDVEVHSIFYSVCQSIFYIICFHYTNLFQNEGKEYWSSLELEKIITSSLNPLKFCLNTIVNEFSRICSEFGLTICEEIIQKNKHLILPTRNIYGRSNYLESFFPFDPYLLQNSSIFINKYYRTWNTKDDEEEESKDIQEETTDEDMKSTTNSLQNMSFTSITFQNSLEVYD
jgi:RNA polymerase I-specific transcription initiation factor RRN3